jgi:hypothetical protein
MWDGHQRAGVSLSLPRGPRVPGGVDPVRTLGRDPRPPSGGATVAARTSRRVALPTAGHQHTGGRQLDFLEARHRAHARVEDRVRTGKDTGLEHLPSVSMAINAARCVTAMIATELLCWFRLLCLRGDLARAEPKTLRYRLLHTAARIVRGQRKRKIKIPEAWPWADELAAAFHAAFALTAPT